MANNITVENAVVIPKALTFNGNGKVLTIKGAAKADTVSGLGILANDAIVHDLTVKLATDAPLEIEFYQKDNNVLSWNDNLVEIYNVEGVILTNVKVDGSGKAQAGIYVNNEAEDVSVIFDNISTTGNRWAGVGINAKVNTRATATFKNVTAASFYETTPAVYSEGSGTRVVVDLDKIMGLTHISKDQDKPGFDNNEGKKAQDWWIKE